MNPGITPLLFTAIVVTVSGILRARSPSVSFTATPPVLRADSYGVCSKASVWQEGGRKVISHHEFPYNFQEKWSVVYSNNRSLISNQTFVEMPASPWWPPCPGRDGSEAPFVYTDVCACGIFMWNQPPIVCLLQDNYAVRVRSNPQNICKPQEIKLKFSLQKSIADLFSNNIDNSWV